MNQKDFNPDGINRDYVKSDLESGIVIKLHVKDTTPPKEKRLIIVGITEDRLILATVYINSEINLKVNWAVELKEQHLFFESKGRSWLDWDSYVDCSKITPRDHNEIESAIKLKPEAIIGKLSHEDLEVIKQKISTSPTIKGKHKKKFGFYK